MSRKCKAWSAFSRDNVKHRNPLSKEAFAAGWEESLKFSPPDQYFENGCDEPFNDALHITDGFGSYWLRTCPQCGQETMEVVRPGKCQCNNPNCEGETK